MDAATSKNPNEEKEEQEKNESEKLSIFVDTQKTTFKKQEDESVKIRDNKLYYQKIGLLYPKIGQDEGSQVNNIKFFLIVFEKKILNNHFFNLYLNFFYYFILLFLE